MPRLRARRCSRTSRALSTRSWSSLAEANANGNDPYARSSDPAKRRSAALTDGVARAPARAMLKGAGFSDEDLSRPLIGIATNWIETMPCNLNQRQLAQDVKRGVRA